MLNRIPPIANSSDNDDDNPHQDAIDANNAAQIQIINNNDDDDDCMIIDLNAAVTAYYCPERDCSFRCETEKELRKHQKSAHSPKTTTTTKKPGRKSTPVNATELDYRLNCIYPDCNFYAYSEQEVEDHVILKHDKPGE